YEIAFLTPEKVKLFRSDFRYVADYLVQKRMTNDYKPSADLLQHVDETLKLMSVLTDDWRFEEVTEELPGKGGTSMCTVLDKVENKGREEGKLEGMIQVYYTKLHYSADQISRELGAPVDQIQEIIRKLMK
ncbi:MAG: transposase, partial [Firmicutes bacterium]|nr:transposase [Bacillota bacterium]